MTKHTFTVEQISSLAQSCRSIRQILQEVNLAAKGGNYQTIRRFAKKHNIDLSHLKGCGWSRDTTQPRKTSTEEYTSNKKIIGSYRLKQRLIADGVLQHKCTNCNRTKWLGNPIPLELDHIDGNNEDNSLSNLRLLCPNCHALTSTYRGRNKTKKLG